jgi:general secretion pathway protein H
LDVASGAEKFRRGMRPMGYPCGTPSRFTLRCGWGRPVSPESGFTLLELVVVLGLMALIMALVLPGLQGSWKRERDRANLRQLAVALRTARSEAATRRQRVRVFLDVETGQYRLEDSNRGGQVTGMRLDEAQLVWEDSTKRLGYIAFYGDGSSSGGKLTLVGAGGQRQVLEVEVITGKVTLKAEG